MINYEQIEQNLNVAFGEIHALVGTSCQKSKIKGENLYLIGIINPSLEEKAKIGLGLSDAALVSIAVSEDDQLFHLISGCDFFKAHSLKNIATGTFSLLLNFHKFATDILLRNKMTSQEAYGILLISNIRFFMDQPLIHKLIHVSQSERETEYLKIISEVAGEQNKGILEGYIITDSEPAAYC